MKINEFKTAPTEQVDEALSDWIGDTGSAMVKSMFTGKGVDQQMTQDVFIKDFTRDAFTSIDNGIKSGLINPNSGGGAPAAPGAAPAAPGAATKRPGLGGRVQQNLNNLRNPAPGAAPAAAPAKPTPPPGAGGGANYTAGQSPAVNLRTAPAQKSNFAPSTGGGITKGGAITSTGKAPPPGVKPAPGIAPPPGVKPAPGIAPPPGEITKGGAITRPTKTSSNPIAGSGANYTAGAPPETNLKVNAKKDGKPVKESRYDRLNAIFESIVLGEEDPAPPPTKDRSLQKYLTTWYNSWMTNINWHDDEDHINSLIKNVADSYSKDGGRAALTQLAQASFSIAQANGGVPFGAENAVAKAGGGSGGGSGSEQRTPDQIKADIEGLRKKDPEAGNELIADLIKTYTRKT